MDITQKPFWSYLMANKSLGTNVNTVYSEM